LTPGSAQSACRGMAHGRSPVTTRRPSHARMSTRAMRRRLARRGPKRRPWTNHVKVHTTHIARRGAACDARRLDDPREDVHRKHSWTSTHLPDTVPGAESKRGGQTTERRSSPLRCQSFGSGSSSGLWRNSGTCIRGERWVRWLGIDEVVGNIGKHSGDSLPEADTELV
jgi:hypothetical protein